MASCKIEFHSTKVDKENSSLFLLLLKITCAFFLVGVCLQIFALGTIEISQIYLAYFSGYVFLLLLSYLSTRLRFYYVNIGLGAILVAAHAGNTLYKITTNELIGFQIILMLLTPLIFYIYWLIFISHPLKVIKTARKMKFIK